MVPATITSRNQINAASASWPASHSSITAHTVCHLGQGARFALN
jgi:hypothetical protein